MTRRHHEPEVSDVSLVVAIIRGDVGLDRLDDVGVSVELKPAFVLVDPPRSKPVVPSIGDVASGVLAYWARGGDDALLWAKVMLAASNTIDLFELEQSDLGNVIMDAIWCLSEGTALADRTVEILRQLNH